MRKKSNTNLDWLWPEASKTQGPNTASSEELDSIEGLRAGVSIDRFRITCQYLLKWVGVVANLILLYFNLWITPHRVATAHNIIGFLVCGYQILGYLKTNRFPISQFLVVAIVCLPLPIIIYDRGLLPYMLLGMLVFIPYVVLEIRQAFKLSTSLLLLSTLLAWQSPTQPDISLLTRATIADGFLLVLCHLLFCYLTKLVQEAESRSLEVMRANIGLKKALHEKTEALSVKAQFISTVNHEIRTPLNSILGLSRLGRSTVDPEVIRSSLTDIEHAGEHLLTLVNNVLDISKIQSGESQVQLQPTKMDWLKQRLMALFSSEATKKQLTFTIDIEPGLDQPFYADKTRLTQIMTNLIGNAIKFTDEGQVSVNIRSNPNSSSLQYEFSVQDTGRGIPEENLDNIFEPFVQVDSTHTRDAEGTGLGLTLSRQIARLMGGNISVKSQWGSGSVFTLTLPIVLCSNEEYLNHLRTEQNSSAGPALSVLRRKRVLMVEDHILNAKINSQLLASLGLIVEVAHSGPEAIAMVSEHIKEERYYHAILMDIQMPGMSGLEATQYIHKIYAEGKAPPIIALTAGVTPEQKNEVIEAGLIDLLPKPFKLEDAADLIARYITLHRVNLVNNKGPKSKTQ